MSISFKVGISIAMVVMLSGCAVSDNPMECSTYLEYMGSTDGSGSASSIRMDNDSDYTIQRVYSGPRGDTEVSSVYIPTEPGEYFIADSSKCNRDEIFRIVDDEMCQQEIMFFRACNKTANFRVVNNF